MSVLISNPLHKNPYRYTPGTPVGITMVVLYGLSTAVHVVQALYTRKWYLHLTVICCGIGETIGWSGRLWSSYNVYNVTPFLMQIVSLIIAPTFFAAGNFIILGNIINRVGPQYSRLRSNRYAIIFVSIDILALFVQAAGGAITSHEVDKANGDPNKGIHIMLVGIIIQIAEMFIYVFLAADFFRNYSRGKAVRVVHEKEQRKLAENSTNARVFEGRSQIIGMSPVDNKGPSDNEVQSTTDTGRITPKIQLMALGLALTTVFLFVRAFYRVAQLSGGYGSSINHNEILYNVLDATMILLAMYTINFLHPGFLL